MHLKNNLKVFSTDFIFRKQENLVDNQKYVRLDSGHNATKCYENLKILKKFTLLRMLIIFTITSICLVIYDLAHDHNVKEAPRSPLHANTSVLYIYRTPAIITCGFYISYPIFEVHSFVFKEFFSENYVITYF